MTGRDSIGPVRTRLIGCLLLGALALLVACGGASVGTPPNVLLVVVDTLRADHLGCYGYPRKTSPRIDALAAEGVIFERAIAQASWTLPSMISLMTGDYIYATTPRLPDDRPALAELFRAQGYTTAAIVANAVVGREEGFDRGFDEFQVGFEMLGDLTGKGYELKQNAGEILNRRALDWAEEHLTEPFFLYVHYVDPHMPYVPKQRYLDFDDDYDPLEAGRHPRYETLMAERPDLRDAAPDEIAQVRDTIDRYDGEIRYLDDCIGELIDGLDDLGVMDNTLFALAADHGEGLYDHRRHDFYLEQDEASAELELRGYFSLGHGKHVFDELIRVPFLFHGPGIAKGHVVEGTVANADLLPTLLDLAGFADRPETDGLSLASVLRDPTRALPRRDAIVSFCEQVTGVVHPTGGLKLVRPNVPGIPVALYDTVADPGEDADLSASGDPDHTRAAAALDRWLREREQLARERPHDTTYLEATLEKMRQLGYIK